MAKFEKFVKVATCLAAVLIVGLMVAASVQPDRETQEIINRMETLKRERSGN